MSSTTWIISDGNGPNCICPSNKRSMDGKTIRKILETWCCFAMRICLLIFGPNTACVITSLCTDWCCCIVLFIKAKYLTHLNRVQLLSSLSGNGFSIMTPCTVLWKSVYSTPPHYKVLLVCIWVRWFDVIRLTMQVAEEWVPTMVTWISQAAITREQFYMARDRFVQTVPEKTRLFYESLRPMTKIVLL